MRKHLLCAAVVLAPTTALGQGTPGTKLTVDVEIVSAAMRGDTARVDYQLYNRPSSQEQLFTFTVDAPSPVLTIYRPDPVEHWDAGTSYRGRSVADWAMLGEHLQPGQQSPVLSFRAVGLPAVVVRWIQGYYPPPPLVDTIPNPPPDPDPLVANSVRGYTVGVEPFPSDRSPLNLVRRMQGLTSQVCGALGWISDAATCQTLQQALSEVVRHLEAGRTADTDRELRRFLTEIDLKRQPPAGSVNSSAYWLLRSNAEYLLSIAGR